MKHTQTAFQLLASARRLAALALGAALCGPCDGSADVIRFDCVGALFDTVEVLVPPGSGIRFAPGGLTNLVDRCSGSAWTGGVVNAGYLTASGGPTTWLSADVTLDGATNASATVDLLLWSGGVTGTLTDRVRLAYTGAGEFAAELIPPTTTYDRSVPGDQCWVQSVVLAGSSRGYFKAVEMFVVADGGGGPFEGHGVSHLTDRASSGTWAGALVTPRYCMATGSVSTFWLNADLHFAGTPGLPVTVDVLCWEEEIQGNLVDSMRLVLDGMGNVLVQDIPDGIVYNRFPWVRTFDFVADPFDCIQVFVVADGGGGPFSPPGLDRLTNIGSDGAWTGGLVNPTYLAATGPSTFWLSADVSFSGGPASPVTLDVLFRRGGVSGAVVESTRLTYDGAGHVVASPVPPGMTYNTTPQSPNRMPTLGALANRVLAPGTRLAFVARAADVDMPPQTLTFSFASSVPAGASLTPDGQFEWTPSPAQGDAAYTFAVAVTDNGLPALAATNTFTVTLAAQPVLTLVPSRRDVATGRGTAVFAVTNSGSGSLLWSAQLVAGGAWARLVSGARGSGAGQFSVAFDANPVDGPARTAVVRVACAEAGAPVDAVIEQAANPDTGTIAADATVGVPVELPLPPAYANASRVAVSGLPPGLKYNAAAKAITGVPAKAGIFNQGAVTAAGVTPHALALSVAPLPAWAQGEFSGVADVPELGSGSASLSISVLGKVSGKVLLAGSNFLFAAASFSGRNASGGLTVSATATVARAALPLTLTVSPPPPAAPAGLGVAEGTTESGGSLTLYRSVWKDAGMAAEAASYAGYYTASLVGGADFGSGFLTFTVDNGSVKVAGKLADNTAVSLSAPLLLSPDGRVFAVTYAAPTSYKGGGLFGIAEWLPQEGAPTVLAPLDGIPFIWRSLNPQATSEYGEGFYRECAVDGGWYDKLINLQAYYADGLTVGGVELPALSAAVRMTELQAGTGRTVTEVVERPVQAAAEASPDGLALQLVSAAGAGIGFAAPKADAPVLLDRAAGLYDYTEDTSNDGVLNTSGLALTFTRATGLFSGTFKVWYDYVSAEDWRKEPPVFTRVHMAKTLSFQGALTPVREQGAAEGRGFFLWQDRAVPTAPLRPYAFDLSYDFLLLGN